MLNPEPRIDETNANDEGVSEDKPEWDDRHASWIMLSRAYIRSAECIARRAEGEGALPMDWFEVLMALEGVPESCLPVGALGQHVGLTRSGLTRLVDRIEAAGLVERSLSLTDRRVFNTVLTDEGREACKKSLPIYARAVARCFGDRYTLEEGQQLSALLSRQLESEGASE